MKKLLQISLLSIFLLNSCSILPHFPLITDIKNFRIIRNTDSALIAQVDAKIYNPNFFPFYLKHLQYKAYVNNLYLGQGQLRKPVLFKAHDTTELDSQVVVISYRNFNRILTRLKQLSNVPVTFFLKARFKYVIFPIFWKKTIYLRPLDFLIASINANNIEQLLSFRGLDVKIISFDKTELELQMVFKNDYPLDFYIDTLEVWLEDRFGNELGKSYLGKIHIPAQTRVILPFDIELDNVPVAVSLLGQFMSEHVEFMLKGYMIVTVKKQKFRLPIKQKLVAELAIK